MESLIKDNGDNNENKTTTLHVVAARALWSCSLWTQHKNFLFLFLFLNSDTVLPDLIQPQRILPTFNKLNETE